jgi:tetratricopeptide (TPR) repeat protein
MEKMMKKVIVLICTLAVLLCFESCITYSIIRANKKQQQQWDAERQRMAAENDVSAHYGLGAVYYERGDYVKAGEAYKKAIAIDPNFAKAHYNLGNVYDKQGDYAEAIEAYKKTIAIDPNFASAYYNLGLAYDKQGNNVKAGDAYKKAAQLGDKDAQNMLEKSVESEDNDIQLGDKDAQNMQEESVESEDNNIHISDLLLMEHDHKDMTALMYANITHEGIMKSELFPQILEKLDQAIAEIKALPVENGRDAAVKKYKLTYYDVLTKGVKGTQVLFDMKLLQEVKDMSLTRGIEHFNALGRAGVLSAADIKKAVNAFRAFREAF